jgi:hypothetical protein
VAFEADAAVVGLEQRDVRVECRLGAGFSTELSKSK